MRTIKVPDSALETPEGLALQLGLVGWGGSRLRRLIRRRWQGDTLARMFRIQRRSVRRRQYTRAVLEAARKVVGR